MSILVIAQMIVRIWVRVGGWRGTPLNVIEAGTKLGGTRGEGGLRPPPPPGDRKLSKMSLITLNFMRILENIRPPPRDEFTVTITVRIRTQETSALVKKIKLLK